MKGLVRVVALSLLVVGCQTVTLVEAEPREIVEGFRLHPQTEWSRFKLDHLDLWTVHGPALESLRITHGLEDGDSLIRSPSKDVEIPVFELGMSPNEIAELVEDTLARTGLTDTRALDLEPHPFGGHDGFRFRLSLTSDSGLRYAGLAAGAVYDERLWLILFTAPELHYFDLYADTVDAMIESVELGPE